MNNVEGQGDGKTVFQARGAVVRVAFRCSGLSGHGSLAGGDRVVPLVRFFSCPPRARASGSGGRPALPARDTPCSAAGSSADGRARDPEMLDRRHPRRRARSVEIIRIRGSESQGSGYPFARLAAIAIPSVGDPGGRIILAFWTGGGVTAVIVVWQRYREERGSPA
jgi:hypothetical protein